MKLQSAIRFLFPPQCISCRSETTEEFGLCGACWREMPFNSNLSCDACGQPLPGQSPDTELCDACIAAPKGWGRGRAALLYEGTARKLILGLKYGDRQDLAAPMADWMAEAGADLLSDPVLVAPVPLHWRRLFSRRYNQAALLAGVIARKTGAAYCPDLLHRTRATKKQDGMTREERQANQSRAFRIPPQKLEKIVGKKIVLVDDVMTSGATLSACTEACFTAGALKVDVLVLARVARDT